MNLDWGCSATGREKTKCQVFEVIDSVRGTDSQRMLRFVDYSFRRVDHDGNREVDGGGLAGCRGRGSNCPTGLSAEPRPDTATDGGDSMKSSNRTNWIHWLGDRFGCGRASTEAAAKRGRKDGKPVTRTDVYPRIYGSQLESRIVLNGSPLNPFGVGGEVTVDAGDDAGDGSQDSFEVRFQAGSTTDVEVRVNGETTQVVDTTQTGTIRIAGSTDSDRLVIDAAVLQSVAVIFDAGGGGDFLELEGDALGQWASSRITLLDAGALIRLTDIGGGLSGAIEINGAVEILDGLAVGARSVLVGESISIATSGQPDSVDVSWQSSVLAMASVQTTQLALQSLPDAGAVRSDMTFHGDIVVGGLEVSAHSVEVEGELRVLDGSIVVLADGNFVLTQDGRMEAMVGDIEVDAAMVNLEGSVEAVNFTAVSRVGQLSVAGTIEVEEDVSLIASSSGIVGTGVATHVIGSNLHLQASGHVGLNTRVATLEAVLLGDASLVIDNDGDLAVNSLNVANGDVTLTADSLTVESITAASGVVTLDATTGGISGVGAGPHVTSASLAITNAS
ncbi:MAG: hypothetical protein EA381_00545, partial [Planctomycetaceae bacterium]